MRGGIGDWITRRALRRPRRTALVDGETGREVSYAEFAELVAATAGALHDMGVRRGDRVALLMENSVEFLQMLFGAASLGAITVPVNFRLSPREVAYVLADSGAIVLAVSDGLVPLAADALAKDEDQVRHVVADLPVGERDTRGFAALTSATPQTPDPEIDDDDVCIIMYTSGTTGLPKGAMLTHGNMLWNAINLCTVGSGLCPRSVTLAVAPMFHIGALGVSVLPLLYAGGTVVTLRSFDPEDTLRKIEKYRVTTQFMVPTMWARLSAVPDFDRYDTSSVDYVLTGGAPCPIPVIEFYQQHGWMFLEGFGMTEASPNTLLLEEDSVLTHNGSVGRPFMHVDVRIVGADGTDVAVGEVGKLLLRGPNIFSGYWGKPEATAASFTDGWFHTGDLGRADAEGYVTLVDRKKDMIISGGENVYPIEVEQVLYRNDAIGDVAVIGLPDELWGERVVAVVVAERGRPRDADAIIEFCRERLAHYKCPTRVLFVDQLPYNATGKLLKRRLREELTGSAAAVHR